MSDLAQELELLGPRLRDLLDRLPRESGVYLLKDRKGKIFYVGKAKSLRARVRSYFTRHGDTRAFVPILSRILDDVETIVTRNEKEALLLENNLIKKHKPRFNVMMRDDKSFLVLRLDPRASYPRLEVTRRIADDGARHFGPYHSASSCRETLRVVNRFFQLRTCTDRTMASRTRPCLQYQIGRCPGPCVYDVDRDRYAAQVDDVTLFLRGRQDELVDSLERRMKQAADALNFERAAQLRDQLAAVSRSLQGQQVGGAALLDQDVFALYREGDAVDFVVLNLREGRMVGRQPSSFSGQEFPDEELLSSFINLYYDGGQAVPQQILVPLALEDAEAKLQWLSELRGGRVELLVPRRGDKRKLVELAARNAESNFRTRRQRAVDVEQALAKLQRLLKLARLPRRIECYDVSGIQGELLVASMVVLQDGEPLPAAYRHFKVRLEPGRTGDDFGSLYQVLARRLRRAREASPGWELPDLIVVDGGKGQLSVALAALKDAALAGDAPAVVALAKERPDAPDDSSERTRAERQRPDRVFLPQVKDPVRLHPNTAEIFLLSRVRDEAHRFAITHHKRLRRKRTLKSGLDEIPGIGPKRRRQLLRSLGSLRQVREATVEQLAAVPGMSTKAAEAVAHYFRGKPDPQ